MFTHAGKSESGNIPLPTRLLFPIPENVCQRVERARSPTTNLDGILYFPSALIIDLKCGENPQWEM